jgi:iron complex outermembrane receptor protein
LPFDQEVGSEWLLDLRVSYEVNGHLSVAVGGDNVTNNYPDKDRRIGQTNNGIVYSQFSPFGFSGGSYYLGATLRW